ncbi:type VII secretion integral membrane protein EccD [Corynebacterium callunae]|uniref:type VII secretion integral membrane protein EccD n=1 Tax=Corynebacterium callunae TaxID=1721 RepID=UPI0039825923
MAIDNLLRLSVRIDLTVGDMPVAMADMALPAASSLAEILDEILELTHAPQISRPWVARTAAGTPIDAGIPLSHTQLEQGGVLVLSPERDLPAPIIRDAAEALVELSSENRAKGLVELITLCGFAALALMLASPLAQAFDPAWRTLIFMLLSMVILVWLPSREAALTHHLLALSIPLLAASTAALLVAGPQRSQILSEPRLLTWVLLSFALTLAVASAVVQLVFQPHILSTATLITISLSLLICTFASIWWDHPARHDFSGPAAFTVAAALIFISLAPYFSAHLAGLRVPTLPTAGQDLSVSDTELKDPVARTQRATALFDAQLLGLVIVSAPLILLVAAPGTWFATAFALCIMIASALHAFRHHAPVPTWSLMVLACASFLSAVYSLVFADSPSWFSFVGCAIVVLCVMTVLVWFSKIPPLEPTTVVWLERLESLAIAAALPLALHLLDVFELLRAMDIGWG